MNDRRKGYSGKWILGLLVFLFVLLSCGPGEEISTRTKAIEKDASNVSSSIQDGNGSDTAPAQNPVAVSKERGRVASLGKHLTKLFLEDGGKLMKFGNPVSMHGDRVLAGEIRRSTDAGPRGAVYLFEKKANGTWESRLFTRATSDEGILIGYSVTLAENRALIVGEHASIFERTQAGEWTETRLPVTNIQFDVDGGVPSAMNGERVVLFGEHTLNIYEREPNGQWNELSFPLSSDSQYWARSSVSMDGNTIVAGGVGNSHSEVFVFQKSRWNGWKKRRLRFTRKQQDDAFGHSVAVSGNTIAVGAPFTDGVYEEEGAVYVFNITETGFPLVARLKSTDSAETDFFGINVALLGNRLLAASDGGYIDEYNREDTVHLFIRRRENRWEGRRLEIPDSEEGYKFGMALSIDGGRIAVGAHEARNSESSVGAVYLFDSVD